MLVRMFRAQIVIRHELSRTFHKFLLMTKIVFFANDSTKTFVAILVFVRMFRAQFVIRHELSRTFHKFVLISKIEFLANPFTKTFLAMLAFVRKFRARFVIRHEHFQSLCRIQKLCLSQITY